MTDSRAGFFSRPAFFAALGAAAAPLLAADPAEALDRLTTTSVALPAAPGGMSAANARAAGIAQRSPFVRSSYAATEALARSIGDPRSRADVLDLLANPAPTFMKRYPDVASREAVRAALVSAGLVAADAPLSGIFPPNTDDPSRAPQPFWSTPGSTQGSHHFYPGGLAVHELFNARIAEQFAATYDAIYFDGTRRVDRDTVVAAALYHDILKSVVFQWTDDGGLLREIAIGGTGAHHPLSGAEAIARGRDARFVITLLSAHAAPSLGDEEHVAAWARASAILAGVDPYAYGLLRRVDGKDVLAEPHVPIEAFVNHLSDHDYVISIHAVHEVAPQLARVAPRYGVDPNRAADLQWWRNTVLANTSAIRLYQALADRGEPGFDADVARTVRTITFA